jgi:phosphopantothenoylcysteine decarboxylase/phosphopantothenate--cysteine ligase
VSGPVSIPAPEDVFTYKINSAREMMDQCEKLASQADIMVMAAAVADYSPAAAAEDKIKKSEDNLTIELVKNPDILHTLSKSKKPNQWVTGFALETSNEKENATEKLKRKNLDMIVLNSLKDEGAGFGYDTNKASFIFATGEAQDLPLMSKTELAEHIVMAIAQKLNLYKL